MPAAVDNLAETFLAFWDAAKAEPLAEQRSLWGTRYAGVYPDVFRLYDAEYGGDATLGAAIKRYPDVVRNIREVSAGAEAVITDAAKTCADVLGVPEGTGRHVVMVGRFASNAWADLFGGVPTCFDALELIPDAGALTMMAAHETAHTRHVRLTDVPFDGATVADTLIKEGLATSVSEAAAPGFGDEVYLWPGFDATPEGEPVWAWLGAAGRSERNSPNSFCATWAAATRGRSGATSP